MNNYQIEKRNMYKKMSNFFNTPAFKLIWSSFTRLVSEIGNFELLNKSLSIYAQQQQLDIKGITVGKNNAFFTMVTLIVGAAQKAYVWAVDNANDELAELFDVVKSDFFSIKESTALLMVKSIRDAINANIVAMISVELTPADVTDIDAAIADYEGTVGTPKSAQEHKMVGTEGIEELMKPMDDSLDLIDRMIKSAYSDSNPDMVKEYENNRGIDKLPTHHSGVSIHIVDNINGNDLEGAVIAMAGKTSTSDINGIAEIIKVKTGTYNLTISRSDYVTQVIKITIKRRKIVKMDVKMMIKIGA